MPPRYVAQFRCFERRYGAGVQKPRQWLPKRDAKYWFTLGHSIALMQWQPHRGYYPVSLHVWRDGRLVVSTEFPSLWSKKMKKVTVGVGPNESLPPLSSDSTVLKRFPLLRQFLTATSYEDGSPRAPGRLWLDNDGIAFRVTLMEPSAFARVALRAAALDDVFAVVETFLGAESPPWEVDQWARDRAGGKKKKAS